MYCIFNLFFSLSSADNIDQHKWKLLSLLSFIQVSHVVKSVCSVNDLWTSILVSMLSPFRCLTGVRSSSNHLIINVQALADLVADAHFPGEKNAK